MAHKKGVGSSKNGRESHSKRLGVKIWGGQKINAGSLKLMFCYGSRRDILSANVRRNHEWAKKTMENYSHFILSGRLGATLRDDRGRKAKSPLRGGDRLSVFVWNRNYCLV